MILVEPRYNEADQLSNRFTLLHVRHWREEATFMNGKGQLITKRLVDDEMRN